MISGTEKQAYEFIIEQLRLATKELKEDNDKEIK